MSSIVCVNADSREFKSLLAKTNFSVGTLKSIIHEYQNNPFLQEAGQYWPSDTYVMSYFTKSYAGSPLQASVWSKKYSAPHVYNTYQEAKAAKVEAQTWFNEDDVYIYENGQGNWVLRVARPIDTKSANAHSKERLIELQSTVDNLINSGVSGRYIKTGNKILDKKNQAAMNTLSKILDNFYRRYGLKVRAYWSPSAKKWKVEYTEEEKKFLDDIDDINASVFTWNEGQRNAIETVVDFLNDRNAGQMIRINGKAGTGKTTIINEILSRYNRKGVEGGKPVVLIGALAHKAKHVLDIKVSKENKAKYRVVPKSIAGMLGLREARKRFDKNGNPSNDEHDKFYDTFTSSKEEMLDGGVPISQADIVIIDEASMVSEEYWDMIKAAKKSHTKFIFLGDKGQLPPIRSENDVYYGLQHKELLGSEADSPVWTDDMPEVTLTERVRQGEDNPLHQITDMYWNFSQGLSASTLPLSSFALDENDLRVIIQGHADIASQSLDLFREAIATQNPNLVKIVTPTNPQVAAYNEQVHFSLHPELTSLAKAEAIMPVKGEIVTMYKNLYAYDPRLKQQVLIMANGDDGVVVDRSPYTTSDEYGVQHVVYFIKKDDGNTVEIPVLLDTPENRTLYNRIVTTLKWDSDNKYGTPAGRQAYAKYMGYKNKYGDLRLGYATTVHKSQGSTYEVAFVNTDGVFGSKRAQAQMMYTALTRASNMTIVSGVGSRAALPSSTIQQANTTIRNNRGKVATPPTATPTSAPPASAPKTTRQYGLSAEQIAAIHAETDDLTKIIKDALVTTQKARLENLPDVTTPLNQMRVGTILDADQVLTMVALDPTATAEQKALAKTLIPLFKKMNIRVRFDETDQGTAGTTYNVRQDGGYDVRIGLNTLKAQKTPSQTVLHELVHSLSVNRLREDTEFRTGVIELMDYVRNFLKERGVPEGAWYNKRGEDYFVAKDTYGVHNEREFFAEAMANPRFQALLKAIPAPKENLTAWQKFCKLIADAFRNLLNIEYKQDSNVYDILIPVIADTLTVTANQGDRTAPFAEWNMERTATMQAMAAEVVKAMNVAIEDKDVHWTTEQVMQLFGNNSNQVPASYEGMITPDTNTIFVFGSNPKGIHGAGAAATAKAKFGAIQGQGEGLQGNAYALPTKDLDKAKNTRWYRPGPKEEAEVKEWYKNHSFLEVQNHPLNAERTMTPQQIVEGIQKLYEAARQNPDKQFKVSHYPFDKLSLNGYLGEEMLAMFKLAGEVPSNVQFNKEWADHWNDNTFNTVDSSQGNTQAPPTSSSSTGGNKPISTTKAIERANGFIGELNGSPYKKEGNRFVLKTGTPVLDTLKTITDRGHNPGTWSYGDPYDGQVSYNIGYSNGQKSVLSATNRDLYDEGWRPTHIMIRREKDRLNQDLDWSTTNNIDQFNDSTFLVNAEDKKLIEYLDQEGYKYELYSDAAVQPTSVDPSLFHLVSGKADGSDKTWAAAARAVGMNVRDYTVEDWDNLDTESKAKYEKYYQDICMQIGRKPLSADSYKGKLVRRDLLQADNADAVFAVGSWENGVPNGGTAYAFMRAFNTGKPIYFFNQDENQWYKSDYEKRQFIAVGVPKLTPAAAVIGTRGDKHAEGTRIVYILRENAKQAIQGVIDNTLGKPVTTPISNVRVQKPTPNIRKVKPFVLEAIDAANKQYKLKRTEVTDATPDEIKSSLDLMFDTGEVPFGVHIIAEGLTKAEIAAINSAECMNKVAIDTGNRKDIAEWTTGYTAEEIALKKQENALLNSTLFGNKELRDLSALTMFKLSEQITKLQTGEESAESILGPDFANSDFEGMPRIEIINAIGLNRLFNEVIKERIFNYNLNPNLKKNRKLMKKAQQIRDNFDAFIRMGYDSLIEKEHIAPNGITRGITADADRSITSEEGEALTDEEIQEIFGSTLESWQTGFRQTSAFTNLTKLIRERLDRLYELDAEGNIVTQEFGIEKNIDSHEAVTKLLKWTQGATDIFDMINKIKAKESENPWVSQLLDILNDDNEEQFRSQFYSNFKKYFQPYHVIFKQKNKKTGEVTTKIKLVNSDTFVQSTLNTIASLDNTGELNIYNGNTHQFDLQALGVLAGARDTIQADLGHMTPTGVDTVIEAFKVLNIPAPSHEEMARLLSDTNVALSIRKSLSYLYSRFNKDSKKVQDKEYRLLREETRSDYQSLINTIAATKSEGLESVSYEAGKMHYSFVTPSWLSAWVESMKGMHGNVEDFINEKYGKIHGWFFNPTDTAHPDQKGPDSWLNYWLAELMDDTQEADRLREIFDHTVVLSDDGVAYQDKSPMQYIASLFEMFSYDVQKKSAWYRIPMMSNKTSEEYLKFARITGDYKKVILDWLCDRTFYQEVNRIRAVNYRKAHLPKVNQIAEFDKNGSQFHFLHMLNRFIGTDSDFGKLLTKVINGEELNEAEGETAKFRENLRTVVESAINGRFKAFMTTLRNEGVYSIDPESGTLTPNILQDKLDKENFRDEMEEFFWNDMFASINILQLTVVDPAQYKNTEDLQKRLAQLHSPGVRADVTATINGRQVTDATIKDGKVTGGNTRTIYIADDKVRSEIVPCLEVIKTNILSQNRYQNNPTAYKIMEQQLNFIIDEFKKVNVTDAQAYTSPTGYRKKMAVFGKWTPKDEELYQKILAGEFNELDLATAWQPLKPFVYTTINKDGKNPYIPTIQIGVQNKNSEYCLIMADALMRSQGMKTKLNVLFDFMERSHGLTKNDKGAWVGEPNTVGIDTIQFDSTVKVGKTGVFEINDIKDEEGNPIQAYTYNDIARLLTSRAWRDSGGNYDDLWVHTIPFNDYAIQQENPIHFLEHEQQQGSQGRILIWADMPDLNENKEPNMITVDGKTMTVAEAKAQYFSAIADNIEESKQSIIERFGLTSSNRKIRNVYLSRILQQEILKDSRYGTDLYWACGLNESGEFNIPLSDPIQSERIQQLLNSIIKNTINKQMIAGGPVVQVSCYGYSEDLSIRFRDKDGNMLQSLSEYRKGMQENWQLQHHTEPLSEEQVIAQYKQYLKANHGSIAYYECYAPIYDRSLLKDFMDAEGNIDMQAIENAKDKNGNSIADKLLQMVGYRIPTEAKYSMVPIRIKGFLPRAAGEGIMLPKEITALSGSDFDIDKLYIMRYQLDRESNDEEIVDFLTDKYYSDMKEIGAEMFQGEIGRVRQHIIDIINGEIEPETYQEKAILNYWQAHRKVTYSYPTEGKFYRDNLIVATHWAVLTSKQAEDQVLSCGNFEELKRVGYMIAAMDNHQGSYEDLSGVSSDGLKKLAYTDKYLQYADVQMQFHKQNMVAGKLIGVFAQSNVSHAFMNTLGGLKLNMPKGFTMRINGQEIKENSDFIIDNEYANDGATRISSILAQLLAASVDAVKDPVLGNLNISMDTVNVATTLVRMGHSLEYVGWFLTHPIIKQLITRYNNEIATGNKTNVGRVLVDMQQELVKASGNDEIKFPEDFNFSQDFFVEEHNRTEDNYVNDWSVLELYKKVSCIADTLRDVMLMTRFNSISSAVGPFASDTMDNKIKVQGFQSNKMISDESRKAIQQQPILKGFREASTDLEYQLLGRNIIQASGVAYSAYEELRNRMGYMSKQMAREFNKFFISYYVNMGDNPVFDLSDEHRKYVLENFPREFMKLKDDYDDNFFVQNVRLDKDSSGRDILTISTRGMTDTMLQDLRSAWADLYEDNKENAFSDKDNLAVRLVEYCFFVGSFGFSPKSFINLTPNVVRRAIPNYMENCSGINGMSNDQKNRLVLQFMLNMGYADLGTVQNKDIKYYDGNQVSSDSFPRMAGKHNGLARINMGGNEIKWYYVQEIPQSNNYKYTEVEKLGGNNQEAFEINPALDITKMHTAVEYPAPEQPKSGNEGNTPKPQTIDSRMFESIANALGTLNPLDGKGSLIETQKKFNELYEDNSSSLEGTLGLSKEVIDKVHKVFDVSSAELVANAADTINALALCAGV